MNNIEKARLLQERFSGRTECYGAGSGACVKRPLTKSVFLQHITGRERIGVYLLRMDGRTGALAVDVDSCNLLIAIEYCARCGHYGFTAHIERSKSKGYHIWWIFDELVPAWKARLVANHVLDECDLLGSVEVFPKQDFLRPGGYGNYINMPMYGRDARDGRTVFLDPKTGYAPHSDQWAFLSSVERISESELDEIIELNDLDRPSPAQVVEREDEAVSGYQGQGLPCFATMTREGVDEGMRNEAALRLSVNLYRTGIPKDLALLMLKEWNMRNRPPLETTELEKAVSSGYLGIYGYGCFSRLIQRYCDHSCPIFMKHNQDNGRRTGVDRSRRKLGYGRTD